jgi:hypothetical protein
MLCLLSSTCIRVGPKKIPSDRFNYATAIATSWKEQMLTNLVKLRYLDPPAFLDLQQIVTQYTLEGSANVSAPDWKGQPAGPAAGISGRWAESPTITYSLMTGDRFIKSLLTPASPVSLLQLIQSGWPVDVVFGVALRSVNGLYALSGSERMRHQADPRFYEVLQLLRELQVRNDFNLRVNAGTVGEETILVFRSQHVDPESIVASKRIRALLGLNPDATEFHIAFGSMNRTDTEIAFLTRSMLDILGESSAGVEIPPADLAEGRVSKPLAALGEGEKSLQRLVHVHTSAQKPDANNTFVAIPYRGYWFWVDDRDVESKRGLGFLMILFTLASPGASIAPPVLTISKP